VNVAIQVAEQMADVLVSGGVTNALNMPSLSAEEAPKLKPYMALAEKLGCTEKDARRLLDPDHSTKLDRFDAAMRAMDRHLVIGFAA
jgi:hypothetical protein